MQVLCDFCVVSYWIDTLVLKTEGNTYAPLLRHPFLFKGRTNTSLRGRRYTFYHRFEGKNIVAKNGSFLEKEFLSKEVSGRKVELDEVIVPSPELESRSSQKSVPVILTPISEEVNDDDHETSDQVTTEPRRSTRVRCAPSGLVIW